VNDEIWREMAGQFGLRFRLHVKRRDLLHATNLRNGTDGFTSLPKEGMPCSNSRTWVPEANMLTTRRSKPLHGIHCNPIVDLYKKKPEGANRNSVFVTSVFEAEG
jgi:hypothetical protein